MIKRLPIVGVMGSGRETQKDLAEPLGAALAGLSVHLLTGGGYGVMHSVSKGFASVSERAGLVVGCIPMNKQTDGTYSTTSNSYPNQFIEMPIFTPLGVYDKNDPDKINRNYINVLSSDIVIALPGGIGTKQEVQLAEQFKKAVVLYGPKERFCHFNPDLRRIDQLPELVDWVSSNIQPK